MQRASLKKMESIWARSKGIYAVIGVLALLSLFPARARAACSVSTNPKSELVLPPQLLEPANGKQPSEPGSGSSGGETSPSITGLWFVNFYANGALFDQGFDAWHSDGTEILNDNAPPEPPLSTGAICLGVWKQIGDNKYKLKHPGWNFDANGNLAATVVIQETITLSADGDSYRGSFVFAFYDLSGKLMSETTGHLRAYRIRAE